MTEKLKQTIKEEIVKMPKEWQEIVSSFDWGQVSEEIGKKYFLDDLGIEDLQAEIALVLVGAEPIADLKMNIEYNAVTSENTAIKITPELFEKIFKPLNDKLTENIKNNLKTKEANWEQNINFIFSDGDYTNFLERVSQNSEEKISAPTENTKIETKTISANSTDNKTKEGTLLNFLKNPSHESFGIVKKKEDTKQEEEFHI
jgi:hypothetical protein